MSISAIREEYGVVDLHIGTGVSIDGSTLEVACPAARNRSERFRYLSADGQKPYIRLSILENSIVQLKKRTSPFALEKSPTTLRIEHLPLPPDSDVLAAEANLAIAIIV
jgi:hypothetical protein